MALKLNVERIRELAAAADEVPPISEAQAATIVRLLGDHLPDPDRGAE